MANKDDASIKGASGGKPVSNAVVTALTAQTAAAPAGAGANGSDSAGNFVIILATINNNRIRVGELETQIAELQTVLQKLGHIAGT